MRFFLSAIGSLGDVNPMITLGSALKRRGHQVAVVTTADGEHKVRESQLRAHCVLSQKDYDTWRSLPREEDPGLENLKAWVHVGLPAVAETIRFVWRNHVPGKSVGLAPALAGAGFVFLRERLQMPVLEVQYSPRDHGDGGHFDNLFGTLINDIRSSIELPPLQHGWLRWLMTHDRAVGLYPPWFFDALDTPALSKVVPTNYLFEPQDDERPLPEALENFLAAGPPPLVVTFGTYASTDANLYRHVLEGCTASGERLVIITRYAEQLPAPLPANCIVVPYVSLKRLFVRCSAAIHHAGAGTMAQAFRAGIPQILCPMAFDQFVNAHRAVALGCSVQTEYATLSPSRLREVIQATLRDPQLRIVARNIAGYFDPGGDATDEICQLIEAQAKELGVRA